MGNALDILNDRKRYGAERYNIINQSGEKGDAFAVLEERKKRQKEEEELHRRNAQAAEINSYITQLKKLDSYNIKEIENSYGISDKQKSDFETRLTNYENDFDSLYKTNITGYSKDQYDSLKNYLSSLRDSLSLRQKAKSKKDYDDYIAMYDEILGNGTSYTDSEVSEKAPDGSYSNRSRSSAIRSKKSRAESIFVREATKGDDYQDLSDYELKKMYDKSKAWMREYSLEDEKNILGFIAHNYDNADNAVSGTADLLLGRFQDLYDEEFEEHKKVVTAYENRMTAKKQYELAKKYKTFDLEGVLNDLKKNGGSKSEIKEIREALYGESNFLDVIGKGINQGAWQFDKSVSATLDFTLGNKAKGLGWKNNPISKLNEWTEKEYEKSQADLAKASYAIGDDNQIAGTLSSVVTSALPHAVLAYLTGGGSLAESGLSMTASTGLSTVTNALISNTIKNPVYWFSFASTVGTDYEEAKKNGASDQVATMYALLTSTINAAIEVGGGIETLPGELSKVYGNKAKMIKWITSSLEEGGEEILQDIVSNLNQKIFYDHDKPIASITDETAIFNPKRGLTEGAYGAAAGAILGGGQITVDTVINAKADSDLKALGNYVLKTGQTEDFLNYAKNSGGETLTALVKEYQKNKAPQVMGEIYQKTLTDLNFEINGTETLTQALDNYARITQNNNNNSIDTTAFGLMINRIMNAGVDPESALYMTHQISAQNKESTADVIAKSGAKVSSTGTAVDTKTGQSIRIQSVASISDDGSMTLKLENGKTVNSKNIEYESDDQAFLYESVARMGVNAEAANQIISGFSDNPSLSAQEYIRGVEEGYRYGSVNYPIEAIPNGSFFGSLSKTQQNTVYTLGRLFGQTQTEVAQKRVTKQAQTGKKKGVSNKGRVVFEGSASNKGLTARQRASVRVVGRLVRDVTHNTVHFYNSVESKDETRVFSDNVGEFKKGDVAPNGFYDEKTGDIWIDLNAGNNGEGVILWTAAHEFVHFIRQNSPAKYKALADFLMEQYGEKGVSIDELIQKKIDTEEKSGRSLSYDAAYEEVVADSMQQMLTDTDALSKIAQLKNQDESIWQKLKDFFEKFKKTVSELYQGLKPQTAEGKIVKEMYDAVDRLSQLFSEGLVDAGDTFSQTEKNTDQMDGVKRSERYENYDKPITIKDVRDIRKIKRKSVNNLTSDELKIVQKWAYRYNKQMGIKSPFFRSFFGDWRASDKSPVQITEIPDIPFGSEEFNAFIKTIKGTVKNIDTSTDGENGWNIRISRDGKGNTVSHSGSEHLSASALTAIRGLIENGILLDTEIHEHHSNNSKTEDDDPISFDHRLYSLGETSDGVLALYRITVEDIFGGRKNETDFRFHNLKYIEKVAEIQSWRTAGGHGPKPIQRISTTDYTVSQLYDFVKRYDKEFNAGRTVHPSMLNKEDGTPKVFYHWTDQDFTVFDRTKGRSNMDIQGMFFSPWEFEAKGYGPNVGQYYLNIKNPASEAEGYKALNKFKGQNNAGTKAREYLISLGYDGVNNGDEEIIAFYPEQIKSATDNIGTFDGENPDIRYSTRDPDATDARTLLSSALESVVDSDVDKTKLAEYKAKINQFNAAQRKLAELRGKIKEMSFAPGKKNTAEIRRLSQQANSLADKIMRYDKQLLQLEASEPLQKVVEREKIRVEKRTAQKYRERIKANRESRHMTDTRNKIKKLYNRIRTMYENPTDNSYIPSELLNSALDLLSVVDIRTGKSNKTQQALSDMYGRYSALKTSTDQELSSAYDENLASEIESLREYFVKGNIYDENMTADMLDNIYDIVRSIYGTIMDAKKMVGENERMTIRESGETIIREEEELAERLKKDSKLKIALRKADNISSFWFLNSMRVALKISGFNKNSEIYKRFEALNDGLKKKYDFMMEESKKLDALVKTKEDQKSFDDARTKKIDLGWAQMTKMQMVQVLLSLDREREIGTHHIEVGGIEITDTKYADIEKAREHGTHVQIPIEKLEQDIRTALVGDEWISRYTEVAKEILYNDTKNVINLTSQVLKHRNLASGGKYIPFVSDLAFVVKEIEGLIHDATIEGRGSFKNTVAGATNALYIEGLDVVLDRAIANAGDYYGLAVPIRNLSRAINVKNDAEGVSVRQAIKSVWGKTGVKRIEETLTDLQTSRKSDKIAILDTLESAFITSVLNGNISVAIKQAASLDTAFAVLRWRPAAVAWAEFGKTVKNYDKIIDEIDEHTSEHWRRRIGLTTDEVATMAKSSGFFGKVSRKLPAAINVNKWIQMIDCWTTATFWSMAKQDVAKGIKSGKYNFETDSDEYWSAVTDLYEQTIEETQPMYDALHRTELQKNIRAKKFFMFRTQPLQNAGMIYEAAQSFLVAKASGDKDLANERMNKLGKVIVAQSRSAITFALMTMIAGAIKGKMKRYKNDEEELTLESLLSTMAADVGGTITGLMAPIGGQELYSIARGFKEGTWIGNEKILDYPLLDWINKYLVSISKIYTNRSIKSIVDLLTQLGDLSGRPISNIYNLLQGIGYNITDIVRGDFGQFKASEGEKKPTEAKYTGTEFADFLYSGDAKNAGAYYDSWVEKKKEDIVKQREEEGYIELSDEDLDKKAKSSVKSSITTHFRDAYKEAYRSKDEATMRKIRKAMNNSGLYDDIVETCQNWIKEMKAPK